jgi:hypothetical protein
VTIRLLPISYDWAKAAAKMRARGLPEDYALSLETGLWPNCDILPPAEKARRGRPLSAPPFLWAAEAPPPRSAGAGRGEGQAAA